MHLQLNPDQLYVTVDLLILTVRSGKLNLLLSRRTAPPYENRWALPGRFTGLNESAEMTAGLLLEEMLPIPGAFLEQLYTFTDVSRDPRGRVISITYLVIVPWERFQPSRTLSVCPFIISEHPQGFRLTSEDGTRLLPGDLAFDHGQILETGIRRIRGKLDYTDIAFHFLSTPSSFSLSDLQTIFEAVSGQKVDSSNFRRNILTRYEHTGRLTPTLSMEKRGRGRPAALYSIAL